MKQEKRKRELIEKPKYYGAPISWVRTYFRGQLQSFRKNHPEFDEFLTELGELLCRSENKIYENLIKFINGEALPNWISPANSMFTVFIKLYNLCLLSEEAFDYIERCNKIYSLMNKSEYEAHSNYNFSLRYSRWDGKPKDFIELTVSPKEKDNSGRDFWFDLTTSSLVVDDYALYMPDVTIEVRGKKEEICNDALCLFENYQNEELYKKIFDTAIKGLIEKGIFVLDKRYDSVGYNCRQYKVIGGINRLNN